MPLEQSLWHVRFVHCSFRKIERLLHAKKVKGNKVNLKKWVKTHILDCNPCAQAKMTKIPLSKVLKESRAKAPNERIHVDVNGPVNPTGIHKEMYTLDIVDEYSRLMWVYPLKLKEDVYEVLTAHINRIEREFDRKIRVVKYLRSDNGGEFVSDCMMDYMKARGIKHE